MKTFSIPSPHRRGFSLVELLAVMAIIGLMISVSMPAISALTQAKDVTSAAFRVKDYMELARNYAVGNNTIVRVGVQEVPASRTVDGKPAIVLHAIKNVDGSSSTTTVAKNALGDVVWEDLGKPLVLSGLQFGQIASNGSLATKIQGSNGGLSPFTRTINGINGSVVFDNTFVISRNGEFCRSTDSAGVHHSFPSRNLYFSFIQDSGSGTAVGENIALVSINGLTGRVQIYRAGDTLPGKATLAKK